MEHLPLLAWPTVVLVLGIVGLLVFRKPIGRLIDRTQKVGKSGIEAVASVQTQTTGTKMEPSPAQNLFSRFDREFLETYENFIRSEVSSIRDIEGANQEQKIVRFAAALYLFLVFEKTYVVIYGSQIGALQVINASPYLGGVTAEFLRPWYDQAAARDSEWYKYYSFDNWLRFLEANSLITRQGDKVAITRQGREFLKFILDQGYTLYRPG